MGFGGFVAFYKLISVLLHYILAAQGYQRYLECDNLHLFLLFNSHSHAFLF